MKRFWRRLCHQSCTVGKMNGSRPGLCLLLITLSATAPDSPLSFWSAEAGGDKRAIQGGNGKRCLCIGSEDKNAACVLHTGWLIGDLRDDEMLSCTVSGGDYLPFTFVCVCVCREMWRSPLRVTFKGDKLKLSHSLFFALSEKSCEAKSSYSYKWSQIIGSLQSRALQMHGNNITTFATNMSK